MNGGGDDGEDTVGESITPDDPLTPADPVKPFQALISVKVTEVNNNGDQLVFYVKSVQVKFSIISQAL